jgi:hypothetical protein
MSSIGLIREVIFVGMLAVSASCGVTTDNQSDGSDPQESTETATQPETQVTAPADLQLITPLLACNASNEGCVAPQQCRAIGGHPVNRTCPAGKQCCQI